MTIQLTTTHDVPAPSREQCEVYMRRRGYLLEVTPLTIGEIKSWSTKSGERIGGYLVPSVIEMTNFSAGALALIVRLAEVEGRSQLAVYEDICREAGK